jgi:hypothetical protein
LGKPFQHDDYLSELTCLRDQLKADCPPRQMKSDKAKSTVSEMAERIKALKAAHDIEATPQRVRHKQAPASVEPIKRSTPKPHRNQEQPCNPRCRRIHAANCQSRSRNALK